MVFLTWEVELRARIFFEPGSCCRQEQNPKWGEHPMADTPLPSLFSQHETHFTGNPRRKNQFMKTSITKLAEIPQTPVFQIVIRKPGANPKAASPSPKSQKRDKIFSKSRDMRENRSTRQMKTTLNSETLFRICGHVSP
jgi:hypothetical protein